MRSHGCHQWNDMGVSIHCIAAPKMSLLKIYAEKEKRKKETQVLVLYPDSELSTTLLPIVVLNK